jgi:hypothetical protein
MSALAVDTAIENHPLGMRAHQPVRELALWIASAVRRRFDRRAEAGCARRRGVAQRRDEEAPGHSVSECRGLRRAG